MIVELKTEKKNSPMTRILVVVCELVNCLRYFNVTFEAEFYQQCLPAVFNQRHRILMTLFDFYLVL